MTKYLLSKCPFWGSEKPRKACFIVLAVLGVVNCIDESTLNSVKKQPWVKRLSLNLASLNSQNPTCLSSYELRNADSMGGGCVAAIVDKYQNTPVLPNQGVFAALHHVKPNSRHQI